MKEKFRETIVPYFSKTDARKPAVIQQSLNTRIYIYSHPLSVCVCLSSINNVFLLVTSIYKLAITVIVT